MLLLAALGACHSPRLKVVEPTELDIAVLAPVKNWAMQLQGLQSETAMRALESASVDMLVIEPIRSQRGLSDFPTARLVTRLQRSEGATLPRKRVIAYLNVGQAEDYRSYWQPDWRAPTESQPGSPAFLVGLDPDGWVGNYPVAYWRSEWQQRLFGQPDALLDQIVADGFDGAYLDWILAFGDANVIAAAERDGVDPVTAMVDLLDEMRRYARERYPLFALIAQNGIALYEADSRLLGCVDALSQEDVSFRGLASASWDEPNSGDIASAPSGEWSTDRLCQRLANVRQQGLPIFTLDYAVKPDNQVLATTTSRAHGFVPYISRTPLDRLAEPAAPAR
ncbi:MAG: endo alpha-1,4 polygalactosaminidase [Planctomycetota bacterium]